MRIVTLARDMRPHRAGDDRVLPDELAAALIASGDARDSRPFPPPDVAPAVAVGEVKRPVLSAKQRYFTRKGK